MENREEAMLERQRIYNSKDGITEISKKFVCSHLIKLGQIVRVDYSWNKDACKYVTRIVGEQCIVVVHGFGIGYGGEGPRGLQWFLDMFGLKDESVPTEAWSSDSVFEGVPNAGYRVYRKIARKEAVK